MKKLHDILIVEDDRDIREVLKEILEMEGYSVWTATNGQEGLDTLRAMECPCLVLLDLMMPVMNGWEFLKAREGDVRLAPIPVVVVSAATARDLQNIGASAVVRKPVDFEVLLAVVRQYCGEKTIKS